MSGRRIQAAARQIRHADVRPKAVELLPRELIEKHIVLPLFKLRDTLTVAVAEPSDMFLLDRLKSIARCEVQLAIATARDIRRTL